MKYTDHDRARALNYYVTLINRFGFDATLRHMPKLSRILFKPLPEPLATYKVLTESNPVRGN